MRVILAGSRSFGLAAYGMLKDEGHDVVSVWSPLDLNAPKPDKLTRVAASNDDLASWSERAPAVVENLEADLFVCAHSHDFISKQSRGATKLGGIGYHPSLLPRHRGRDAVKWTIHMGDAVTGGSVYWLTDNVDGGPIAAQELVHVVPGMEASTLWRNRLFPLGITLLRDVLRDLEGGTIVEVPQDERCATWEPSWERPPLFRPDLTQIGAGVNGYRHVVTKGIEVG